MNNTEKALFVRFVARLVNEPHENGVFCAFRCPPNLSGEPMLQITDQNEREKNWRECK